MQADHSRTGCFYTALAVIDQSEPAAELPGAHFCDNRAGGRGLGKSLNAIPRKEGRAPQLPGGGLL